MRFRIVFLGLLSLRLQAFGQVEQLTITLDRALRLQRDARAAPDLLLRMECQDGRYLRGVAWFDACPQLHFPVEAESFSRDPTRVTARLQVDFRHAFPAFQGGRAVIDLDMERIATQVLGSYRCEVSVTDERQTVATIRENLAGSDVYEVFREGLKAARTESDDEQVRAHGRMRPGPLPVAGTLRSFPAPDLPVVPHGPGRGPLIELARRLALSTPSAAELAQVAGFQGIAPGTLYFSGRALETMPPLHDPTAAMLHAVAGLQALRLFASAGAEARDGLREVAQHCAWQVRGFAERGVGRLGAPLGHAADAEAVAWCQAFADAWDRATDSRLLEGTGLPLRQAWLQAWQGEGMSPAAPLAFADERAGFYVFRSGWKPEDVRVGFRAAVAVPEQAGLHGDLSLTAFGRDWISAPPHDAWPQYADLNGLQVRPADPIHAPEVWPMGKGSVQRVRVVPEGSGSVGTRQGGFLSKNQTDEALEQGKVAWTWQTLGVDVSGTSGADALLVLVGGDDGFRTRPAAWTAHLGKLGAGDVTIDDNRVTIRPAGGKASLVGTVLYPEKAELRFHPAKGEVPARLDLWVRPPDDGKAFTWTDPSLEMSLEEPDARHNPRLDERRKQAREVRGHLEKVVTSVSMGAPTLSREISQHYVIVFTLRSQQGAHPAVKVLPASEDALCTVGPQRVRYWESLVEFETGMRDRLRGPKGGGQ